MRYMLVSAGAAAAAAGDDQLANPYLEEAKFPRATGETVLLWADKVIAWDCGWKLSRRIAADLSRPQPKATLKLDGAGEGVESSLEFTQ